MAAITSVTVGSHRRRKSANLKEKHLASAEPRGRYRKNTADRADGAFADIDIWQSVDGAALISTSQAHAYISDYARAVQNGGKMVTAIAIL
ncbi:hypothetical protein [Nonomuraea sp. NPDC049504]|uniref:hypothetical protein n=1 Tax=Nonomuraea sp. NPDC049504 TaxID=3154729 RepID=UPI0034447C7D